MYDQIASVLDSNRSYNERTPSRHSTDSFSPRRLSNLAVWMTPASQEAEEEEEPAAKPPVDEEDFSEPTQPTRGAAPIRKLLLSEKSESQHLPPWLTSRRAACFLWVDRQRQLQYLLACLLMATQILPAAAISLPSVNDSTRTIIIWWSAVGSLTIVLVHTLLCGLVSLVDVPDLTFSEIRPFCRLTFAMATAVGWEVLTLPDTWIFLFGLDYLYIFRGMARMGESLVLSSALLSAGFMMLSIKNMRGGQGWVHDPNNLYYDLDCIDMRPGGVCR